MAKRSEIAAILVEGMGIEATMTLVRSFGGKMLSIPRGTGVRGVFIEWMDLNLGPVAAIWLRTTFGGERLTVPMLYDEVLASRNRLIVADYDAGVPMLELVRKYNLSERQIRTILSSPLSDSILGGSVVDDRQMMLF